MIPLNVRIVEVVKLLNLSLLPLLLISIPVPKARRAVEGKNGVKNLPAQAEKYAGETDERDYGKSGICLQE